MEENKFELQSDYIHEIMNDPPKFITVWGNLIIYGLIAVSIIVISNIRVTTENVLIIDGNPTLSSDKKIVLSIDKVKSLERKELLAAESVVLVSSNKNQLNVEISGIDSKKQLIYLRSKDSEKWFLDNAKSVDIKYKSKESLVSIMISHLWP